jgi:hypothetical protein
MGALTRGIEQRVRAINAFLHDIYHRQEILRAGRIPVDLIARNEAFLPQMIGVAPPGNVYTHIVGIDLVRTGEDEFFVLEDNARTPSGVSYMLENRETMLQMFPELFTRSRCSRSGLPEEPAPVARRLRAAELLPRHHRRGADAGHPQLRLFRTRLPRRPDGRRTGRGHDLRSSTARSPCARPKATRPIDVLYRRVDDDFLDPLNFNPESMLGVPGIMDVYRAGGITIANAPGTGIADDKAIYSYMPDIVEFYTGEKAILQNVPTWRCSEADSLAYVLDHLDEVVVKEVHGSGGYGMLVGPAASKKEIATFRDKLEARPGNYIAQPTLALSTVPILTKKGLAPRHVDLRPFVLVRPDGINITPGGLTRVALKKGSLVVNSSRAAAPRTPGCWRNNAMLGKTAGGLFWMFRYLERSENTARLIEAGFRIALTRSDGAEDEWMPSSRPPASPRASCRTPRRAEAGKVIDFLLRDKTNPSSVISSSRRRATMPAWCARR